MGVETELKFRLPARRIEMLARGQIRVGKIGERNDANLVSTYFDTGKHKLRRHGLSLRIRQTGDKYIQTIKSAPGAQFGRGEWETEVEGNTPDLGKIDGTPLECLASKSLRRKLKPIFETSVHRTTVPVRTGRSEIELAVDRGKLVVGRRASPIEELELELKKGQPGDLFRLAKTVERKAEAELYFRTKSERGYDFAFGKNGHVVYAEPIELKESMEAGEAFRIIGRSTVRHFAANADAVQNLEPEGIHQMRVGLRRLRAAISLFSHALPGGRTEKIKTELKWLTNELAPAREIDVFVKTKISRTARDVIPRRGGEAIDREFAARRIEALERARKAVRSERCRGLFVDVLEWIEVRAKGANKDASIPIRKFAADTLHRRAKKVIREGRELDKLSPPERHRFRIRIKKIRYAVEFFESLSSGKRDRKQMARLSKHLKKIQDALGSLNDLVAHQKLAADVALKAPPQNRRARAFVSGVVLGREAEAVKPLLKVAIKEVRELHRANAF
jgi:inorganic triphosphatase YgiF